MKKVDEGIERKLQEQEVEENKDLLEREKSRERKRKGKSKRKRNGKKSGRRQGKSNKGRTKRKIGGTGEYNGCGNKDM